MDKKLKQKIILLRLILLLFAIPISIDESIATFDKEQNNKIISVISVNFKSNRTLPTEKYFHLDGW